MISRFLSRCLKGAEDRYPAIEGEALASLFVMSPCGYFKVWNYHSLYAPPDAHWWRQKLSRRSPLLPTTIEEAHFLQRRVSLLGGQTPSDSWLLVKDTERGGDRFRLSSILFLVSALCFYIFFYLLGKVRQIWTDFWTDFWRSARMQRTSTH